jgi:hypothetical protein
MLAFVWGVVDVLGSGLLRAYRRYQVRRECLRQMRELVKLSPKAPWYGEGEEAPVYLPIEEQIKYQQQLNHHVSSIVEQIALAKDQTNTRRYQVRKEFK